MRPATTLVMGNVEFGSSRSIQTRDDLMYHPGVRGRASLGGTMKDAQTEVSRGYEVIFPVAVGAVFLVVLVVGAIIG